MKVQVGRAGKTLKALGYRTWMSESRHTLNARRGQNHITIALPSGNISAHRDIPIATMRGHRALKEPFTQIILKEFREAYRSTVLEAKSRRHPKPP